MQVVGLSSRFRLSIRFVVAFLMLIACGDIELNPSPKKGAPATILRADHPGNIKEVMVCVYFKESLPVRCLPNSYLKECLILEVVLTMKEAISFHCTGHLVKRLMNLTHLSLI